MEDKVLHGIINQRMRSFFEEYFEEPPANRFEPFLAGGQRAYPVLMDALLSDEVDHDTRIDALMAMGRLFEEYGPTHDSLEAVVAHAKEINRSGMGPERQATFFALGRSRADSLMDSFLPLLKADGSEAINIACYVLGYAQWQGALADITAIVEANHPATRDAAVWALGEIGGEAAVNVLLPLLDDDDRREVAMDALGSLASAQALEPLLKLAEHRDKGVRLRAVMAVRSIVIENKESLLSSGSEWMYGTLEKVARDEHPPIAVFSMLILAELGRKLDREVAFRVLQIDPKSEQQPQH